MQLRTTMETFLSENYKNRIFRSFSTQKPFINYRFSNHMVQLTLIFMSGLNRYGVTTHLLYVGDYIFANLEIFTFERQNADF